MDYNLRFVYLYDNFKSGYYLLNFSMSGVVDQAFGVSLTSSKSRQLPGLSENRSSDRHSYLCTILVYIFKNAYSHIVVFKEPWLVRYVGNVLLKYMALVVPHYMIVNLPA